MKNLRHFPKIPRRAVVVPLAALFWNQLVYQGAAKLAESRFHYDFSLPIDHQIPLIPWTITIYFGYYLLWAGHYIWMAWRDDLTAKQFYTADFLSKLLMIIIIAPMTRIPAFLPAATFRNVKAVNGITSLLPRRNAQLHKHKSRESSVRG